MSKITLIITWTLIVLAVVVALTYALFSKSPKNQEIIQNGTDDTTIAESERAYEEVAQDFAQGESIQADIATSPYISSTSPQNELESNEVGEELNQKICEGEIDENIFILPLQETVFIDPEGRYTLTMPEDTLYRYNVRIGTVSSSTELRIWTTEQWKRRERDIRQYCTMEGGSGYVIEFISSERIQQYNNLPSSDEIVRTVESNGQKVAVYQPLLSFAGHEEAYLTVQGGVLKFFNPLLGEGSEVQDHFDQIIKNIKIPEL